MSARSYGQYCALAKALDVVGERWTMLIVRELFVGPSRYVDLLEGIPGISTDMLASRLKHMEASGLLVRRTMAAPTPATVYELTERGRELKPVLLALANWGLQTLEDQEGEEFRAHWVGLMLGVLLRSDHALPPTFVVQFEINGQLLTARIVKGRLTTSREPAEEPNLVVHTDASTLARVARSPKSIAEAVGSGKLRINGTQADVRKFKSALAAG